MHLMVKVDERDEASVRSALESIGVKLSEEPPEQLEGGQVFIFCEFPKSQMGWIRMAPGVLDVMADYKYEQQNTCLMDCEAPDDPDD